MKYTSEIIQKVVTSEACLKALERISPIYGNAENFLNILNAIFTEIDVFVGYGKTISGETIPQTAKELLPYWEIEYGISKDASLSVEDQRARVLAKIRANASMNPYKLQEIIRAETGVIAFVVENTGKNHFTVRLMANNQSELRHSIQINNVIKRYKPAHLIYSVKFETRITDELYHGGFARFSRKLTLHQHDSSDLDTGYESSVLGESILGLMELGE